MEAVGKREANKIATRQSLQAAADRLFAGQGYEATTVRDIADAAGVTERTFFRYFDGKEALIVQDVLGWLPFVSAAITARPVDETPLTAIENALVDLAHGLDNRPRISPAALFTDGPPGIRMARTQPRLLLQIEEAISLAVRDRIADRAEPALDVEYQADICARYAVAAMRSALIRDWQLRSREQPNPADLSLLLQQAFSVLH